MKTLLLIPLLLPLAGCTSLPASIKALAASKAIAVVKVNTVYGVGGYIHVGMTNVDVTISPDGTVTIKK